MNRYRVLQLLPLYLLAFAAPAAAQPFPVRPIEFVVHTGPGGGADLVARAVAEIVQKERFLPQLLIVQNRAGGSGAVAQNYVAGKRGDPYTLFAVAVTVILSVPIRTGMDVGLDKFQPLGLIGVDLNGLAVRSDSPFRTVKDLVDAARANPKTINIAVGSIGATAHYFVYRIEQLTGAKFNVVSMKTGPEAVVSVIGGHVHATAENLGELLPQVETKRLRLLGVPALNRLPGLPDVPTLKEQGLDLHIGSGRGFCSPAGVSRDVVTALEDLLAKVHRSAGWRDFMTRNMYEDVYMNAEEFGRHLTVQNGEINRFLTDMGLVLKK